MESKSKQTYKEQTREAQRKAASITACYQTRHSYRLILISTQTGHKVYTYLHDFTHAK